jgi:hypothetical protein
MIIVALLVQAITGIDPEARPWTVFRAICMEGGAVASQVGLRPSSSAQLSAEARHALGRNLIDAGLLASVGVNFIVSASEGLSNPVYELDDGRAFLILPMPPTKKMSGFEGTCAVVVKGDHYVAALTAVDAKAGAKVANRLRQSNGRVVQVPEYRRRSSNREISIVEIDGWTSAAVNSNK